MKDAAKIPLLLKDLKLPTFNRHWERMATEAKAKGWCCIKYLSELCELELTERKSKRLKARIAEAKLPKGKSFETYDFSAVPGLNKRQIDNLIEDDDWIKSGRNVLIFGPSGLGKTHLAAAIGERLILNGSRVLYTRTTDLVQRLQLAKRELNLPQALQKLDKYDCLILDDFGYVKKSELETGVLFELICERYERKSLFLTCNQLFKDWDEIFVDKAMAVAAIDRLVHHSSIIEVTGESYRRRVALNNIKSGI